MHSNSQSLRADAITLKLQRRPEQQKVAAPDTRSPLATAVSASCENTIAAFQCYRVQRGRRRRSAFDSSSSSTPSSAYERAALGSTLSCGCPSFSREVPAASPMSCEARSRGREHMTSVPRSNRATLVQANTLRERVMSAGAAVERRATFTHATSLA